MSKNLTPTSLITFRKLHTISHYPKISYNLMHYSSKTEMNSHRLSTRICEHDSSLPFIVPEPVNSWFFIAINVTFEYQLNTFDQLINA